MDFARITLRDDSARRDQWQRTKGYTDGYAGKPAESKEAAYQLGWRRGRDARREDFDGD